jgi:hypothetical protein
MIPYDLDPTLHTTQPHEPVLDDGFSRPEAQEDAVSREEPREPVLTDKSDF